MGLEDIVGGSITPYGMIEKEYRSTGFSVNDSGSILKGYNDSGFRIGEDGSIRDHYGMRTGVGVSRFGTIGQDYSL